MERATVYYLDGNEIWKNTIRFNSHSYHFLHVLLIWSLFIGVNRVIIHRICWPTCLVQHNEQKVQFVNVCYIDFTQNCTPHLSKSGGVKKIFSLAPLAKLCPPHFKIGGAALDWYRHGIFDTMEEGSGINSLDWASWDGTGHPA